MDDDLQELLDRNGIRSKVVDRLRHESIGITSIHRLANAFSDENDLAFFLKNEFSTKGEGDYCLERELHGIFLKIIGAKVSPRLVSITFIINSK